MSDVSEAQRRARVAAAIHWAMGELEISKTGLAKAAGLDFRTVDRLLDGKGARRAQLSRLAHFFGWPGNAFDDIADGVPPPPVSTGDERTVDDRLTDLERRFDRMEAMVESLLPGDVR